MYRLNTFSSIPCFSNASVLYDLPDFFTPIDNMNSGLSTKSLTNDFSMLYTYLHKLQLEITIACRNVASERTTN